MIQLLICDDDIQILEQLKNLIYNHYNFVFEISCHNNVNSLCAKIEENISHTILILMDIELHGHNGIYIAKNLQKMNPFIKIIFITGFIDYAQDIFDASPVYFLVKPINEFKLYDAVDRAIQAFRETSHDVLSFVKNKKIITYHQSDIYYIESFNRTITFFSIKGNDTFSMKLNEIEPLLSNQFIRCHQSFIVNIAFIQDFSRKGVFLQNEVMIPISRKYYERARDLFLDYIGEMA